MKGRFSALPMLGALLILAGGPALAQIQEPNRPGFQEPYGPAYSGDTPIVQDQREADYPRGGVYSERIPWPFADSGRWGWLGLIGLAGLAGLLRRSVYQNEVRDEEEAEAVPRRERGTAV